MKRQEINDLENEITKVISSFLLKHQETQIIKVDVKHELNYEKVNLDDGDIIHLLINVGSSKVKITL